MIKVKACLACNASFSNDDAEFVPYMSMLAGAGMPHKDEHWHERALPVLRSNRKLLETLRKMELKTISQPDGTEREVAMLDFPAELFLRVLSRLTRGLYYYHKREILPPETNIICDVVPDIQEFVQIYPEAYGRIMRSTFAYFHVFDPEDPTSSWWLFSFLHAHFWQVATGSEAERLLQSGIPRPIVGFIDASS